MSRAEFREWECEGVYVSKRNRYPVLTYCEPMEKDDLRRIERFFDQKMTEAEMVLLAQDVIEAGQIFYLGPNVLRLVQHMMEMNLCAMPRGGVQ